MAPNQRSSASARRERPDPPPRSARSAALALLGRRDYTTAELRDKLHDKGYDPAAIDAALDDLRERRFVDDQRVAAAHVRTAAAIKGRGRVRIARELAARGLDRDLIDATIAELDPGEESGAIRKILQRKRWPAKPTIQERQKMFRHLLARGFTTDAIGKALGRRHEDDEG